MLQGIDTSDRQQTPPASPPADADAPFPTKQERRDQSPNLKLLGDLVGDPNQGVDGHELEQDGQSDEQDAGDDSSGNGWELLEL